MDPNAPVHPKLPFGLGSQVALTGVLGAIAAAVGAVIEQGITPSSTALIIAAVGATAAFFGGRSSQAKTAIETNVKRLQDVVAAYQKYVGAGTVIPGGDQPGSVPGTEPPVVVPTPPVTDEGTAPGPGTVG